jgi:hypothetical protein
MHIVAHATRNVGLLCNVPHLNIASKACTCIRMQGKRGIEKPAFQLPTFIEATGIAKLRQVPNSTLVSVPNIYIFIRAFVHECIHVYKRRESICMLVFA